MRLTIVGRRLLTAYSSQVAVDISYWSSTRQQQQSLTAERCQVIDTGSHTHTVLIGLRFYIALDSK